MLLFIGALVWWHFHAFRISKLRLVHVHCVNHTVVLPNDWYVHKKYQYTSSNNFVAAAGIQCVYREVYVEPITQCHDCLSNIVHTFEQTAAIVTHAHFFIHNDDP